jgi:hypothetical protein
MTQLTWPAVICAALVLFWAPVLIALIRGTEKMSTVVLLTMLTLLLPPAWFVALASPFLLPRAKAPAARATVPPHLAAGPGRYRVAPRARPPAVSQHRSRAGAGSAARP